MDGVQLAEGQSHFEEAVYFLPLSSHKLLVLILPTSKGWKDESTLEPPSGSEQGTPGLGIQALTTRPSLRDSKHPMRQEKNVQE